jgi:hypothetical protein
MARMEEEYKAAKKYIRELEHERWYIIDLLRYIIEEIEYS